MTLACLGGFSAVSRIDHAITVTLQNFANQRAHTVLVLDQQNRFRSTIRCRQDRPTARLVRPPVFTIGRYTLKLVPRPGSLYTQM